MSAEGKYTVYAPPANSKNALLNRLFRSNDPVVKPIVQDMVGQEDAVRAAVSAIGKAAMQPAHQDGDPGHFPNGVDLNFSGAPDLTTVTWASANVPGGNSAGGPATAYFPDISSPGPGKTDGVDKAVDPNITTADIKPSFVPGGPGRSTRNPSETSPKIVVANELGTDTPDGNSGCNV